MQYGLIPFMCLYVFIWGRICALGSNYNVVRAILDCLSLGGEGVSHFSEVTFLRLWGAHNVSMSIAVQTPVVAAGAK